MKVVLIVILTLSFWGLFMTFLVEQSFVARSIEAQPIARTGGSDSDWGFIGAPKRFLSIPPDAYVTHPAPGIPPQVDSSKLDGRAQPLGPILQTILYARAGTAGAFALALLGFALRRRLATPPPE